MIIALLACITVQAQFKPSKTCKFLTAEEAAALIGAGVKLDRAIEDGGCTYSQGRLKLDVQQPVMMSDRKVLQQAFEASSAGGAAKQVAGIGDRAYIKKENSGHSIMFLKGNGMGGISVYGEGSDSAAMADKLVDAAKKVASRY